MKQNGDGYGTSLTYDIYDGISAGFAYSNSKRLGDQNSKLALGRGDNAETYTGGLKYDANNIYPGHSVHPDLQRDPRRFPRALLTKRRTSKWLLSTSSTSVCVRPWLTCSLKVRIWKATATEDILKYVDVGATYYFNKNMSTYVDYKINLLDDNSFTHNAGISTDDVVALGLGLPVLSCKLHNKRRLWRLFLCPV